MKELYPQSIESARKADPAAPEERRAALVAGRQPAAERQVSPMPTTNTTSTCAERFRQQAGGPVELLRAGFPVRRGQEEARRRSTTSGSDLRSLAYFGLCDCERKLTHFDQAIAYCQKSLTYDDKDPYAHYALGLCYEDRPETNRSAELAPALKHLQEVVAINPDLDEAKSRRRTSRLLRRRFAEAPPLATSNCSIEYPESSKFW